MNRLTKKRTNRETRFVSLDPHLCVACLKCAEACPKKVIGEVGHLWHHHAVFKNAEACIGCGKCVKVCPQGALFLKGKSSGRKKVSFAQRLDRSMPLLFLATAITGVALHIAGHGGSMQSWHNWAIAHVVTGFLWSGATIIHIKRRFFQTKSNNAAKAEKIISALLSFVFFVTFATGLILLAFVDGDGSLTGLRHYALGILLIVLILVHRIRFFRIQN